MDEEYKQSDISKVVEQLMDEEGYEFGEAVKKAMEMGYKDGGLMVAIQKFNQGGNVIDSRATVEDMAKSILTSSAATDDQKLQLLMDYDNANSQSQKIGNYNTANLKQELFTNSNQTAMEKLLGLQTNPNFQYTSPIAPMMIMPPTRSTGFRQGPGYFGNEGIMINGKRYKSEDEAIDDMGVETYNRFMADGGMAGGKTYHQFHDQYVPIDEESMGYANGGGIGSMMQPKKNYAVQGGVENYSPSEMVTVPKFAKSAPDHPSTQLAYITDAEKNLLVESDLHGSLKDGPNKGPSGLMSLNGGFNEPGGFQGGGNQSAAESGDLGAFGGGAENRARASAVRSAAINAGAGQNVNAGFFGNKYNNTVTPQEITAAKAARNNPNNPFSREAYNRTRGFKSTGLGSLLSNLNPFSMIAGLIGGPFAGLLSSGITSLGKFGNKLGNFGTKFAGKMRGIDPLTGKPNTQKQYDEMVASRRNVSRLDNLYDKKLSGKNFSQKNIDMLESMGITTSPGNINSAINRDLELNPEMPQFARSYLNSVAKSLPNQTMAPPSKPNVMGFNEDIDVGYNNPAFENDLMAKLNKIEQRTYDNLKTGKELDMNTPEMNKQLEQLEQKKNEAALNTTMFS